VIFASIVLAVSGAVAYRSGTTLADASDRLVHAKDVELALERTLSVMRDAETGQRGFLLTRRPEYLEPYELALAELDAQLMQLRVLLADDAEAQRPLEEITALVQMKTNELARTVDLERNGERDQALAVVLTDAGRVAMDEIRAAVGRMEQDAERNLAVQLAAADDARSAAKSSILAATALAIMILCVLVVVTRRDSARIRASERRLATTLRSIGDAVMATDERGRVTVSNPIAERLTGWPLAEALGKPMDDVFHIVNEETRATVESPVSKALREGQVVGLANHTLLIRRDGAETPIEDSAAPIVDDEGRLLGVVLAFRDASERRAAEQALLDADRRKDEFLAVLAHELRNPLAPIRQATQVARSPAATEAQIRWSHEVIERQVGHMARLLDDLLDVSRITRGTLEVRKSRVTVSSIVAAAVEMARPLIEERGHKLEVNVADEPLPLDADPLRIAQVIANLLTNAAKYTHAGGHIRIDAARDGGAAAIRITDDGIGLTDEALANIFQMFVQIGAPLERGERGLGVGLALSKGLVELHGGEIEAQSAGPDLGSTFVVRLPLAEDRREPAAAAPQAAEARRGGGLRILVADDNRDAATSLGMVLELDGHHVEVVHDGGHALDAISQSRFDLALLDIGMPNVNGYDVARRVRADNSTIMLVAVTGWGQDSDRDRALAAGFDHHWVKPIEPAQALELCAKAAAARAH
jgi:PAS domain S-box-containing protein